MNKDGYGHVWLVGAGPGDAELITVKGKKVLRQADVIIYDHLISMSLLNDVKDDAVLICAGKRADQHLLKQSETNELLIDYAKKGYHVARLKGGDPFIFGRGGEEALRLKEAGISFTIVPGVSSAYAVPAYNGIPVTHRTCASSLHIITGHESKEKRGNSVFDYEILAKEEGTLVFLMGLGNLSNIAGELIRFGKNPKTPTAVLSQGTTARQKACYATLDTIEEACVANNMSTPAIIVIGDVTTLGKSLSWYEKGPLAGVRIMSTGTKRMAEHMADEVHAYGGEPVSLSLINTRVLPVDYSILDSLTWIVFTSGNGVDYFFQGLKEQDIDLRRMLHLKIAVIGSGTKKALKRHGFHADYMPDSFVSADLATGLSAMLTKDDRVGLFRAKVASKALPQIFDEKGISYQDIPVYETIVEERRKEELLRQIGQMDYITFGSSSAVHAFADMIKAYEGMMPKLVSIGPITTKTMEQYGLFADIQADTYNVAGIIESIVERELS